MWSKVEKLKGFMARPLQASLHTFPRHAFFSNHHRPLATFHRPFQHPFSQNRGISNIAQKMNQSILTILAHDTDMGKVQKLGVICESIKNLHAHRHGKAFIDNMIKTSGWV